MVANGSTLGVMRIFGGGPGEHRAVLFVSMFNRRPKPARRPDTNHRRTVHIRRLLGLSPADAVLRARLSRSRVIIPGEHVDYWDKQGWRTCSSNAFSVRQVEYTSALRREHTPQMIVNGRDEFVGSDYGAASRSGQGARDSARQLRVTVTLDPASGTVCPFTPGRRPAYDGLREQRMYSRRPPKTAWLACWSRREQGRDLHHTAVVRC